MRESFLEGARVKVGSLPEYLKAELRKGQYCAVYAAGPREVVSKRLGDNRGCRPVRFGIISTWNDAVTPAINSASYATWAGLLFRVWCSSTGRAKTLLNLIEGEMSDTSDAMRGSWYDLGPELNLKRLERSIRTLAEEFGIATWNDDELHKLLMEREAEAKQKRVRALRRGMVF
jgi:hypothetical protein